MTTLARVFCGVDTHAATHTAAIVNALNVVLGTATFPATTAGYQQLRAWAESFGTVLRFGIEGTGSYGAGLTRFLLEKGCEVREVNRPNRQHRRRHGKSDPSDAVAAAMAAAGDTATGSPRCPTGATEAARNLRNARNLAVTTRTRILNQTQAILVTAPAGIRETFTGLKPARVLDQVTGYQPRDVCDPTDAVMATLAALADIYHTLCERIDQLTAHLDRCVRSTAPNLCDIIGIGTIVAADLIITAGTNPDRIHSEAAFAALCGVSAVDASSGKQQRHRLNRGGDRQANAALHRAVIVSLAHDPAARHYLQRRQSEGKTKREIIRCLKRYLARRVWTILTQPPT